MLLSPSVSCVSLSPREGFALPHPVLPSLSPGSFPQLRVHLNLPCLPSGSLSQAQVLACSSAWAPEPLKSAKLGCHSPPGGSFQVALPCQASRQRNQAAMGVGTWCAEVGNQASCRERRRRYRVRDGKDLKKKKHHKDVVLLSPARNGCSGLRSPWRIHFEILLVQP